MVKKDKIQGSMAIKNPEAEFSFAFVNELIQESEQLDIEIPNEIFQREKLQADLQTYFEWKKEAEQILDDLEVELLPRNFKTQPVEMMDVDQEADPNLKNLSDGVQEAYA